MNKIKRHAIVFGYNEYALQIVRNIRSEYESVRYYVMEEANLASAIEQGFDVDLFDLSDDWESIKASNAIDDLMLFCALENTANNIFLTISLRATFETVQIVALANDQESGNKLKMAGANKVIPMVEATANVITGLLESPVSSNIVHRLLYEESELKLAQITVAEASEFVGKYLHDIRWHEVFGVIILAIVDNAFGTSFIFTGKGQKHRLDPGNMLIVIGYEKDIKAFERSIGGAEI